MTDLRAELDRIIDQHFEPSVMGRTQAVDEILAAVDAARPPINLQTLSVPVTSGRASVGGSPEVFIQNAIDAGGPTGSSPAVLIEERRILQQRRGGW